MSSKIQKFTFMWPFSIENIKFVEKLIELFICIEKSNSKKYFFFEKPIELENHRGCSGALLFEDSNSRGCLAVASAGSALLSHFCPTETFCKQRRKSKRRIFSWILKILNKSIDQKCFTELFGCISSKKMSPNVF